MNDERIAQFLQFLKEEPNEPFNIYCLAIEYKNHAPETAMAYFNDLLKNHPQYLPTYYHAAELLINSGDIAKAEKVIIDGIELAISQDDQLALRELRNLKSNLLDY